MAITRHYASLQAAAFRQSSARLHSLVALDYIREDSQYCTYRERSPRLTKVMSSIHSGGASALDAPSNVAKPDAPAVGYPRLADIMSKSPETQIFRSFSQLNILNILRLQAELHDLDRRLTKAQRLTEAQGFGPNINQSFSTMRSDNAGDDESQASLLEEIDRKLERYSWWLEFATHEWLLKYFQTLRSCSCSSSAASRPRGSKTWTACWSTYAESRGSTS